MSSKTFLSSIIFVVAIFFISLLFNKLNIYLAKKWGIVDHPKERGIHAKAIPVAGGLSFAIPIIISNLFFYIYFKNLIFSNLFLITALGGSLVALLGFFDDIYKHSAKFKLIFQIGIAIGMYYLGFKIDIVTNPFGADFNVGLFSFPLTILWYLLIMNSINLIDGLDGLAAGISLIVCLILVFIGYKYNNFYLYLSSLTAVFSLLAFLKFNFTPAKIFMGDTGSLFLGFYIATLSIAGGGQYKGITAMTLLIPIIALFIPLSDTFLAVTRRLKGRKNIFEADKEHLHHKLLEYGFSQKTVAIIMYFVTFLFALIAFGFSFTQNEILIITLLILSVLLGIFFYIFWKGDFYK